MSGVIKPDDPRLCTVVNVTELQQKVVKMERALQFIAETDNLVMIHFMAELALKPEEKTP